MELLIHFTIFTMDKGGTLTYERMNKKIADDAEGLIPERSQT